MIKLRSSTGFEPAYMTQASAGADLRSTTDLIIKPGTVGRVPTGVFIEAIDWSQVPSGMIPELQIRARSGLAFKKQVTLANGVGTIDADYPDEICVLLINHGQEDFTIKSGDRIAQIVLNLVYRLPLATIDTSARQGGFGSTGV